jgi:rhodanese-related sulfurtransferase
MPGHRQLAVLTILIAGAVLARVAAQQAPQPQDASAVVRLSQDGFKKLHASESPLVIDVRDAVAYAAGHIPGAIHVPLVEMDRRASEVIKLAKNRTIVTYCSCPSEHSSAEAGWLLMKHGARDVRALVGGYVEWSRSGGKIER